MELISKKVKCVLCGKKVKEKKSSELKYEFIEEDGSRGENSLGYVCSSCADVLDEMERLSGYETED